MSDKWLVRTTRNEIQGPFEADELKRRITSRLYGPDDEICRGNHYWVFLREQAEVKSQLGLEISEVVFRRDTLKHGEHEITQTQIGESESVPDLDPEALNSEETSMIRNRALREFPGSSRAPRVVENVAQDASVASVERPSTLNSVATGPRPVRRDSYPIAAPEVRGGVEAPLLYRGLAWVLAVGAGVLVFLVIRLLEGHPR